MLVLSILAVVSLIGFTFMYVAQTQLRGANSYLARLQAKYLAEAGINHAKRIVEIDKEQGIALDSFEDLMYTAFQGSDVDLDNDGISESKWFYVKDDEGKDIGRYAVLVEDEAGKVNINTADQESLNSLFNSLNIGSLATADAVINYRYGSDEKPGEANKDDNSNNYSLENDSIDNNNNGFVDEANEGVDEPSEFNIDEPWGDDQPFVVKDELKNIAGISSEDIQKAASYITVSSKDQERDAEGYLRQNINSVKPDNLIKIMLDKGVSGAWQKAANVIDSLDRNFARTTVFKHFNLLDSLSATFEGDWTWINNLYECSMPEGEGTWTWNLPISDGEYYCFIYGFEDNPIGEVTIGSLTQESMNSGDLFAKGERQKVNIEGGVFKLSIKNNEEFGQTCYFRYVELIPGDIGTSFSQLHKEVNGAEALRINEIMVKPKFDLNADSGSAPGGYWIWQNNYYVNSQPESGMEGEGTWVFDDIPNGYYYLRLLGKEGEFIGDVEVNGRTQTSVRHGDYFTAYSTVYAYYNKLTIEIRNNFEDKTCYFKGIALSQQPDAEYVELVNISAETVDLSGWILETTGQEAVAAFIPQGTAIAPFGYLVLCVDKDDQAQDINSNNISFKDTWSGFSAVQLDFFKTLDRDFDFLNDDPVSGENFIILKDAKGKVVDKVEYLKGQIKSYIALERADPTDQKDSNGNSEFDGWYATIDLSGGTPGKANDNIGMDKDQFSNYDIREMELRNSPVTSVLDLIGISQSSGWNKIGLGDVSLIIDSLTTSGILLYADDNNVSGWTQTLGGGGFYSNSPNEEGIWRWENLSNGNYFLTIKGASDEAITASYKKADGSWQTLTQGAIPNEEGLVFCGSISIGEEELAGTENNTLEIKIRNVSSTSTAHFYYLRLDPVNNVYGRVNINTAPKKVLLSLPNMNSQAADAIINERPFGNKSDIYRGIGDLFLSSVFSGDSDRIEKLKSLSSLVTVRSNVFEVISRAQILDQETVIATQEIKSVIERQ